MEKMWAGRFSGKLDSGADRFNSSVSFDSKMYAQDIRASVAHAQMLAECGIITHKEASAIIEGLQEILEDIESGTLEIDEDAEDIHTFVESLLISKIGETGKKLHTARSRNDQVSTDLRLYLRDEADMVLKLLYFLIDVIKNKAEENAAVIMPGYTHLQRAQPLTFGHHLLAYAMMFIRDVLRIKDAVKRMNYSPLGCCALSGTSFNIDRYMTAEALGFDGITLNSVDGVSDRDFCIELMSAFSLIMMHLSRFSEEIILWSSREFGFIELDDAFSTGSSIMPQKKNPDIAEGVRGKTGRVYGDLLALLTSLKGLPLAYNKDMQEDKEAVFDSVETVKKCLSVFSPMIESMKIFPENMKKAAHDGFINATDLADYLVRKGLPFRTAYKIVGNIVGFCIKNNTVLEKLPFEKYMEFDCRFDRDLYEALKLENCVKAKISAGGTGEASVKKQLEYVEIFLEKGRGILA